MGAEADGVAPAVGAGADLAVVAAVLGVGEVLEAVSAAEEVLGVGAPGAAGSWQPCCGLPFFLCRSVTCLWSLLLSPAHKYDGQDFS